MIVIIYLYVRNCIIFPIFFIDLKSLGKYSHHFIFFEHRNNIFEIIILFDNVSKLKK